MREWLRRRLGGWRRESEAPAGDPDRPRSDHVYEMLECVDGAGARLDCTVGWADGPLRQVTVTVPGRGLQLRAEEVDLFGAFLQVRRQLEGRGLRLVCAGARLDCWPSAMARQMGMGETAYLLRPGVHAGVEERVYLFARTEPERVGTVAQQEAAYRCWLDSLPDEDEDEE